HVDAIGLDERRARLQSHRLEESARHRAPDEESIDLRQQVLNDVDLSRDLRAAENGDERPLGIDDCRAEILELLLHQQARYGRLEVPRYTFRRRVRAMRRPEGVVDVDVAELREPAGK